jgi:hypothetical protein
MVPYSNDNSDSIGRRNVAKEAYECKILQKEPVPTWENLTNGQRRRIYLCIVYSCPT